MVGFTPDRDYRYIEINRALRRMHPQIVNDAIAGIETAGGSVVQDPATDLLTINDEFTASIVVVRCRTTPCRFAALANYASTPGCGPTSPWRFEWISRTSEPLDYYLLPRIDMTAPRVRLAEDNGVSLDSYRFDALEAFFGLAGRTELLEVA